MKAFPACAARACIAALLVGGAVASAADDVSATGGLTLARALELTRERNSRIAAFAPQDEALRSRTESAALRPNDVLQAELENFAGHGRVSGVESLESTLRLARVLELGDKARLRRRIGDAELEHLEIEQRAQRMDILTETALRFVRLLADQEYLEAARRATALGERVREIVRERVDAGAASPAALSRAQIEIARAQLLEEHAEHELASSRVRLAAMWGSRAPRFERAVGELFDLPPLADLEALQSGLERNPDLLSYSSQDRLHQARLRLAEAQRRPDLTVSLGVRRLEAFDEQALVAGFAMPLGARRRADLEARAVEAERRRLDRDLEARRFELHVMLFELYQELLHTRAEVLALREQIRPRAQAMLETVDQGYRAGRFSLLELADAQGQLLEIDREAIRAAAGFHTYLIEIERLTDEHGARP